MTYVTKCAAGLVLLLLGSGLACAEGRLDPMSAIAGRPAGSDPLDPMTAVLASDKDAGDESAGNEELGGFPDGPGAEDTFYQCTACHSAEIIKQQKISDQRWEELWTWMVEAQGMVEPDEETKKIILAYLKENFSSER